MGGKVNHLLLGSYLGLSVAVVGGMLLMPELFTGFPHRGISFWGNYFPAFIPYATGLLITIVCLFMAGRAMPDYPERLGVLRRLLWAISLGLAVILLTPEQANVVFYWAHTLAAVYLFAVAGLGVAWIMLHAGKTPVDWFLFAALVMGTVISLLSASYIRVLGLLALGQVLALGGGALVIIRAALRWSVQEVKE